jgi:hypothetical protein
MAALRSAGMLTMPLTLGQRFLLAENGIALLWHSRCFLKACSKPNEMCIFYIKSGSIACSLLSRGQLQPFTICGCGERLAPPRLVGAPSLAQQICQRTHTVQRQLGVCAV